MHVVITGGTGLIGRSLSGRLVELGHRVTVLSRSADPAGLPSGVELCVWDGKTGASLTTVMDSADAVVNLAGENIGARRWTMERKTALLQSRLSSAAAVTEALLTSTVRSRVIIQPSGAGIYGTDGDRVITETDRPGKDYLARLAVEWERAIQPAENSLTRVVTIRMGIVLSREDGVLPRLELPIRLFIGGPLGMGRQWYSWIHLEDVVEAIIFLLQDPCSQGSYNLVAPQPVRQAEFSRLLAKRMNRPYWAPAPGFLLRLALGEMAMLVLEGQNVLPTRLQEAGFQFQYPDLENALADLYA